MAYQIFTGLQKKIYLIYVVIKVYNLAATSSRWLRKLRNNESKRNVQKISERSHQKMEYYAYSDSMRTSEKVCKKWAGGEKMCKKVRMCAKKMWKFKCTRREIVQKVTVWENLRKSAEMWQNVQKCFGKLSCNKRKNWKKTYLDDSLN